jgi:dsRNA-specific ribonuclease
VWVEGKVLGTGEGSSKKKAEQMASQNACKKLNITHLQNKK